MIKSLLDSDDISDDEDDCLEEKKDEKPVRHRLGVEPSYYKVNGD